MTRRRSKSLSRLISSRFWARNIKQRQLPASTYPGAISGRSHLRWQGRRTARAYAPWLHRAAGAQRHPLFPPHARRVGQGSCHRESVERGSCLMLFPTQAVQDTLAVQLLREAKADWIESLLEDGLPVPQPASLPTAAITPWRWLVGDRLRSLIFDSRRAECKRLATTAGDHVNRPVPVRRNHDCRGQPSTGLSDRTGENCQAGRWR